MKNVIKKRYYQICLICLLIIIYAGIYINNSIRTEAQTPTCGCPIASFTPLPQDAENQALENDTVLLNINTTLRGKIGCFADQVRSRGGDLLVTSAFRTIEYQKHLFAVWEKQRYLARLTRKQREACGNLVNEINMETMRHGITYRPNSGNNPSSVQHFNGDAIDVNYNSDGISVSSLVAAGRACGLCQTVPGDTAHFGLCP